MTDEPRDTPPVDGTKIGLRVGEVQAADLAGQIAQLARVGLPLSPGFRAMAAELPRSRSAKVLRRIANRLDAGEPLEAAMEAEQKSFPRHLRSLIVASVRTGKLAGVLERFVSLERSGAELRRRVWLMLAYPILLMLMLLGMFSAVAFRIVPQFRKIYEDFGTELPALTRLVLVVTQDGIWALLGVLGGLVMMWLVLRMVAPSLAVRVWYVVPVAGPMSRWATMARFCRLMELLLEQQVPAPEALRLCANGVSEADLARGCRRAAVGVESGRSLVESFSQLRQFPPTLEPFLEWGQKAANMPVAFQAAAEAFEGRVRGDIGLLEAVLLPFTLLIVLSGTFFLVIGLFVPLIGIIQNLT